MVSLDERPAMAARALAFTILTAARSGEVLGARWPEIDLDKAVWTVPARRMKAGREHRVPLSPPATALVSALHEDGETGFVFSGPSPDNPPSIMAMSLPTGSASWRERVCPEGEI